jgi:hypothetical protein
MSRPSGRVGNERLITDFLGRMRFVRSPHAARSVVLCRYSYRRQRGDAGLDAVVRVYWTYT